MERTSKNLKLKSFFFPFQSLVSQSLVHHVFTVLPGPHPSSPTNSSASRRGLSSLSPQNHPSSSTSFSLQLISVARWQQRVLVVMLGLGFGGRRFSYMMKLEQQWPNLTKISKSKVGNQFRSDKAAILKCNLHLKRKRMKNKWKKSMAPQ